MTRELRLHGVGRRWGDREVLSSIDLTLRAGERVVTTPEAAARRTGGR